ncbi:uncharacterized protein METZ01_LOCUS504386, partial [marine metagenome]
MEKPASNMKNISTHQNQRSAPLAQANFTHNPKTKWASGPESHTAFLHTAPHVKTGSRQVLCLWLPTFELRLELVRSPQLDNTSVALLSPSESTRQTVWQVSRRAQEAGV